VANVLRGKIVDGKAAFRIANGTEIYLPLEGIKEVTPENNDIVAVHNELLDRKMTYPNGKPFSEDEYEAALAGWFENGEEAL
jgi:hypothetical protein